MSCGVNFARTVLSTPERPELTRFRPSNASLVTFVTALSLFSWLIAAQAQQPKGNTLILTAVGPREVLFDPKSQGCDGNDIPDAPLRAYRDADGAISAFGLHHDNRRLTGKDFRALKLDCTIVFRGLSAPDPKRYNDKSWIAATWTGDGRIVHGLVHHEFQANRHLGRCSFPEYLQCWWNSILSVRSGDGGKSFAKTNPAVAIASADPSEVAQGRHRGFFNPSNIIERDGAHYVLVGTTGWDGRGGAPNQPSGVCLFRNVAIADDAGWRGWDGSAFTAAFPDPYTAKARNAAICAVVPPLPAPIGSLTRHRGTGLYVAVYQASNGLPDTAGGRYERSGFYAATSADLIRWSPPQLIFETKSLYDSPCSADVLRSYPSLVDPAATTRNFEDIGDEALLTWSEMRVNGCNHTHDRVLVARKIRISAIRVE
jgi:hypothetical protein